MLMATPWTLSLFFLLVCNIISSYLANVASSEATPVKPRRLPIKLIHHDSIQSPYYNPYPTISERAERAINGSLARVRSLSKIIATPNKDDFRADVIPTAGANGFSAKISIGTPPVPQLVLIDTASDLLWLQCLPCTTCYEQSPPLFDPTKSSSYSNVRCDSIGCSIAGGQCDVNNEYCLYDRSYLDSTFSAGNLASEQVTFETSDEGTVQVPIVLGCGHVNKYTGGGQESGMLGLSNGNGNFPTLVKQLGSMFSYCIGNIHDPQYQYNQLILGEGAILQGGSSTLQTDKGFYYVDLQGISVGEKKLPIDPKVFQKGPSGEGGVIIDSGTTFTFLTQEGYAPLETEVKSLIAVNRVSHLRYLCYAGSVERDLTKFPTVTLRFSGGAQLGLDTNSMFFQLSADVLCMAILPLSPEMNGESMIGVTSQQAHNIGYDVRNGKIFFQRIDCGDLVSLV